MISRTAALVRRFTPLAAFLGGFIWDALTLGRNVTPAAFWSLGAYLLGAAAIAIWLAYRHTHRRQPPASGTGWRGLGATLRWRGPYLLMQFLFGGIFSALFILYFKSSGHLGTWLTTALLGALLVGNEFARDHYGRRFTTTWTLFALNAILLLNFVLPHLAGSLEARWFYLSTVAGIVLTLLVRRLAPGRPGQVWPVWAIGLGLMAAFPLDMIAPVPLVKRALLVGHEFRQAGGSYLLGVERAPAWQFWRDHASVVHLVPGERLYGVSAVFAPRGMGVPLEHRWEVRTPAGWQQVSVTRFQSTGGREKGFRGFSWVQQTTPGEWRFSVGTQDGRTIDMLNFRVEPGSAAAGNLVERAL
jgi:hypothetical protein